MEGMKQCGSQLVEQSARLASASYRGLAQGSKSICTATLRHGRVALKALASPRGLALMLAVALLAVGMVGDVHAQGTDPQPTDAPDQMLYSVGVDFEVIVDAIAYRIGEFLNKWIFFVIGFGVVLAIVAFMKRGK